MLDHFNIDYFLSLIERTRSSLISRVQSDASRLHAMTTTPNKVATTLLVDEQASKTGFRKGPQRQLHGVFTTTPWFDTIKCGFTYDFDILQYC